MHADRQCPVRIGLSGWNYAHWRGGVFYPPRLPAAHWLEFYAERFDTVEVNSTFYRLPRTDAVAHWLEQTPEDFVFSIKASRYLTHVKRLRDLGPGLERFVERIEPLLGSPKLGPLLWQLPPTFRRDHERDLGRQRGGRCRPSRLEPAPDLWQGEGRQAAHGNPRRMERTAADLQVCVASLQFARQQVRSNQEGNPHDLPRY